MIRKNFFSGRSPYSAILVALVLALTFTSVAQAVLMNHKLSGSMIRDGRVNRFDISPDGQYTVFKADAFVDEHNELFSARTLGGNRVQLSLGLPNDCNVREFFITPDSQYVVYSATTDTSPLLHCGLYSVPIGGGTPIELDPRDEDFQLYYFIISNNSTNVVFALYNMAGATSILYRTPVRGGSRRTLSEGSPGTIIFSITSDSRYVIYREIAVGINRKLIRSDMAGNTVKLCEGEILNFLITPDDAHVIFRHGSETGDGQSLYTVPTIGGYPALKLSGTGTAKSFRVTPDSKYVVYLADEVTPLMYLLYRKPVDGSGARLALTPWGMVAHGDVSTFKIAPNSQYVVYDADQQIDNKIDLYSISINGSLWNKLSKGMINDGDIWKYEIAPNSEGVVVLADAKTDNVGELFAVNMAGTWAAQLNQPLPAGSSVVDFEISPNSLGVVYWADQEEYDIFNLYAVPVIGGEPVRLNPKLNTNRDVILPFMITPDSKGVLYRSDQERDGVIELFVTYDFQSVNFLPLIIN